MVLEALAPAERVAFVLHDMDGQRGEPRSGAAAVDERPGYKSSPARGYRIFRPASQVAQRDRGVETDALVLIVERRDQGRERPLFRGRWAGGVWVGCGGWARGGGGGMAAGRDSLHF